MYHPHRNTHPSPPCTAAYGSLMVGRTITGVGVGVGLAIAPLYGAELAPKSIRGGLVTL